MPIGAVVADEAGRVIGQGRNRTREAAGQPLAGTRLAHAEVNALLSADFTASSPEKCRLFATTEPCPLCIGAVVMSNVKSIVFASRDPWAGASNLLQASEYMRRQNVRVAGPADPALEEVLVSIQVAWHLRTGSQRAQPVVDAWLPFAPRGVTLGRQLHATGELSAWAERSAPVSTVLDRLAQTLPG